MSVVESKSILSLKKNIMNLYVIEWKLGIRGASKSSYFEAENLEEGKTFFKDNIENYDDITITHNITLVDDTETIKLYEEKKKKLSKMPLGSILVSL